MESDFQKYIDSNELCEKTDRILLGISGGIDSVCMFHLFRLAGYPIGIAHCNFQLREEESEQDELFVRKLAGKYDIPFFTNKFNTGEIAEQEGISIQMAARDLRYEWFNEIKNKYDYKYIAIAHNSDDIIETFLINLSRGSGIKGLTGIKPKTNDIIRPLLFASRNTITDFITENNFEYREDSSNQSTKYNRNLIRHDIIPLFEKINPRFRETMSENIKRLKDTEKVYLSNIKKDIEGITGIKNQSLYVNIAKLKKLNPINSYLYEILHPFGFSNSQILDVINSLDGISGKQFFSLTHRLIKDRNELIIEEISVKKEKTFYINKDTLTIQEPISLNISNIDRTNSFRIVKNNQLALLDLDKIQFPLALRKWRKGDYFMPLGMKFLKKLSDFFIDIKISIAEKEDIWILESNNKIIWIVGQRIDDRFKISDQTTRILRIELKK